MYTSDTLRRRVAGAQSQIAAVQQGPTKSWKKYCDERSVIRNAVRLQCYILFPYQTASICHYQSTRYLGCAACFACDVCMLAARAPVSDVVCRVRLWAVRLNIPALSASDVNLQAGFFCAGWVRRT